MIGKKLGNIFFLLIGLAFLLLLPFNSARAVPSFARQTGVV